MKPYYDEAYDSASENPLLAEVAGEDERPQ